MENSEDVFKFPTAPSNLSTAPHVAFKMPQAKKIGNLDEETQEVHHLEKIDFDNEEKEPAISKEEKKEFKQLKQFTKSPAVDSGYKPPVWSGPCTDSSYDLDILKDGRMIGNISLSAAGDTADQTKPFYIFGRQGDVVVEHPSISRYHTVVQYRALGSPREIGWYIFDMGSTHGTFLNKEKVPPFMFVPIRVGHMFKLGFSTRMYILNGPDEDREPESNMSVTEIKERTEKQKAMMSGKRRELEAITAKKEEESIADDSGVPSETTASNESEDTGISWGMSDDYGEDEDKAKEEETEEGESMMESIEDIQKREQAYADDPKKALKNFFDRQGRADEMQFELSERGSGSRHQWTCRIELPIETETGRPVFAEATVTTGKKEATVACALEACRILDAAGILRKSNQDSKKRKSKEWAENDYYDSDEDTFLDRTGEVERKREKRRRQAESESDSGHVGKAVETYDSLSTKLHDVNVEINRVQVQLDLIKAEAAQEGSQSTADATTVPNRDTLDTYMATMSRQDAQEARVHQSRLRLKLAELKKSAERLEKLVKIAKPAVLPPIAIKKTLPGDSSKKQPVFIGTMKGHRLRKLVPTQDVEQKVEKKQTRYKNEELVEEEDEDEEKKGPFQRSKEESVATSAPKKISVASTLSPDKQKVYTVPPPVDVVIGNEHDKIEDKAEEQSSSSSLTVVKDQPRRRIRRDKTKPAVGEHESLAEYDPADINYATWLPPENQSGDGRTSLNEKFGY